MTHTTTHKRGIAATAKLGALTLLAFAAAVFAAAPRTFAAPSGGDDTPAWLKQAAAQSTPAYDRRVPAVVLHDEAVVSVGSDGRVRSVTTFAVRLLTREGRGFADVSVPYLNGTDKVKELRAWLISPGGHVKRYGKDETADVAAVDNDVYNEARAKLIHGSRDAEAGAVFGYQYVTEERDEFGHLRWFFQGYAPSLRSRLTLTLPANWRARGMTFNRAGVEPTVSGTTYTWELTNLPPVEDEPEAPRALSLVPHVAVAYAPAGGGGGAAAPSVAATRAFSSWADISRWYTELSEPQSALDDNIAAKAREVTAGAKGEFERVRAVGRFVQNLQYISVQIGAGRYRPHAASEVLAKSYGDCKDKANLMRTMLKALRLTSYLVPIYSGDPTHVREEWPSPTQFNHVIIAVKVSDETQSPAVLQHPTLGRLLVFDPTDPHTPVGDLPDHEQGSFALIAAGDAGGLVRMPVIPPEANRLERQTEVALTADGALAGVVRESSTGQAAAGERRMFRELARPQYQAAIEEWITRAATGARVNKVSPADDAATGRFSLEVEFVAPSYAQVMQGRLLVFKPAVVSRRDSMRFGAETRKHPVVLDSETFAETVRVKLPEGFAVDELPDAVKLEAPFGTYAAGYEVKDGHLLYTRSFSQRAATVPAAQYKQVRDFYHRMLAAEHAPVVLAKQ